MKPKSPKSLELYDIMIKRGYPAEFCDQITKKLAILSDRNRIMQKHEMEEINARWNEYLNG